MAAKRNRYIGGSMGTLAAGAWGIYSNITTIRDLPDDAGWVAKMIADPPIYAPWLLFGICLIFLGWVFWERKEDEEQDPTANQSKTHGDNSHAFAGTFRDVNIGTVAASAGDAEPEKVGDMSILDALDHIISVIGPQGNAVAELRQAAIDGRVKIWGCQEIKTPELSLANRKWRTVWSAIPRAYWQDWQFIRDRGQLSLPDTPHTEREDGLTYRETYGSLKTKSRQITTEWRHKEPPKDRPSGPPRPTGPNSWMAG